MKTSSLVAALALLCLVPAAPADAGSASQWVEGGYSRVRLVNAGNPEPGLWRAGLEIDLNDGWKTYWRSPGETGVPPVFDWAASSGAVSIEVRWPVPHRFMDSGLESIGYKGDVVLPIEIRTDDSETAPRLDLQLSYAVCAEICVPEDAVLALDLSGGTGPRERLAVDAALAMVPERGAGQAVMSATAGPDREAPLLIEVASPDGELPDDIFVEGPQDWYLPAPAPGTGSAGAATAVYELPLGGLPAKAEPVGARLTVTVVRGGDATEEVVTVEAR